MKLAELQSSQMPISAEGLAKLNEMFAECLAKDNELKKSAGDAFGGAADWHDNATKDQWVLDARIIDARMNTLNSAVSQAVVIEPQREPGPIDLGHTVEVKFEKELDPTKITILGPYDSYVNPFWISYKSELAQLLFGKIDGETIKLSSGLSVTVMKVLSGEF